MSLLPKRTPNPANRGAATELIAEICRDKRMPIEAFMQFRPTVTTRGRMNQPVARVPVYDEHGETHSHFDLAPGGRGRFARGESMEGVFFPGRLPEEGEQWLIVERVSDAAALLGLGFNAAGVPISLVPEKHGPLFRGVDAVIVPDLDQVAEQNAHQFGRILDGVAKSVRIARIPGELKDTAGDNVRDVLNRIDGHDAVRRAVADAIPWQPGESESDAGDGRPEVLLTLNEGEVAEQVVAHLGDLGWETPWVPERLRETVKVYTRGGTLVDAIESEDGPNRGQLIIRPLPTSITRERITQSCHLVIEKPATKGVAMVPCRPPKWLIDAVHDRGWFDGKIRALTGVIQAPTLRQDGSIYQTPGYDPATRLIYRPGGKFPSVPEQPTQDDARRAISELLAVVSDFPFLEPADKSAWLGLVLSLIGRHCIAGCVPMFAITANVRGAGKSLLVDAASWIAYGRPAARKTFTRDEAELRKVITAVAIEATPSVLFDNVDQQIGGAALDAALTAETWSDRILGRSATTGELPMNTIWSCTGNNLAFGSDAGRRVLPIRLQSPLETPEDRGDFHHADLLGWVRDNRPRLAVAALTILRGYFVAGCPIQASGEWGSFTNWSALVRSALVWAGAADPLATRVAATANDDARELLAMLIVGVEEADPDGKGVTTNEIERLLSHRTDEMPPCPTLAAAASEICGERFNARRFGRRLRSYIDRIWEGRKITCEKGHGKVNRWAVRPANGGFGGFGGFLESDPEHGTECVLPEGTASDAHGTDANQEDQIPPNPTNPPPSTLEPTDYKCGKCGATLVRKAETLEVNGWVNLDCPTPGCKHVKPVRIMAVDSLVEPSSRNTQKETSSGIY